MQTPLRSKEGIHKQCSNVYALEPEVNISGCTSLEEKPGTEDYEIHENSHIVSQPSKTNVSSTYELPMSFPLSPTC